MGNSQQVVATGWHKIAILGGWIATFLLAAWILVPRLIIGTAVPIALALTILLPIILFSVRCYGTGVSNIPGQGPCGPAGGMFMFSFPHSICFWLLFPDDTIFSATSHEQATALIAVLFGPGWEGAGSAIANP